MRSHRCASSQAYGCEDFDVALVHLEGPEITAMLMKEASDVPTAIFTGEPSRYECEDEV